MVGTQADIPPSLPWQGSQEEGQQEEGNATTSSPRGSWINWLLGFGTTALTTGRGQQDRAGYSTSRGVSVMGT